MRKVILEQQETNVIVEGDLIGKAVVVAVSKLDEIAEGVLIRSTSGWQIASTHSVRLSDRFYPTRAELMKAETDYEFFTP